MLPPGPAAVVGAASAGLAVAGHAGRPSAASRARRAGAPARLVAEQVLEALAALLEPDERQAEVGDARRGRGRTAGRRSIASRTVRPSATAWSPRAIERARRAPPRPPRPRPRGRPVRSVKAPSGAGAQEPAGIDRDEEVADPLDLAEQVAGAR